MEQNRKLYSGNLGKFRNNTAKRLLVMDVIKKYFTLEKELPLYQRDIASCNEIEKELAAAHANAERLAKAKAASDNAEEVYFRKKREFIEMKQDVSELIDNVSDIKFRTLLKARILERKTNNIVASLIHYSGSATSKMYMPAIQELEKTYRQSMNENE